MGLLRHFAPRNDRKENTPSPYPSPSKGRGNIYQSNGLPVTRSVGQNKGTKCKLRDAREIKIMVLIYLFFVFSDRNTVSING